MQWAMRDRYAGFVNVSATEILSGTGLAVVRLDGLDPLIGYFPFFPFSHFSLHHPSASLFSLLPSSCSLSLLSLSILPPLYPILLLSRPPG